MKIHFRKIANADGPTAIVEKLDISGAVKGRKDITSVSPLSVELNALPAGADTVHVAGKLGAETVMLCSRCLTPVELELDIPFDETFKWMKQPEEPDEEEEDLIYVQDEMIDLVPYVEESFQLNLPISALCKQDCRGLCQTCGQNLNEGSCDCDNTVIDPRLAGLKDFFNK